jgi:Zn-dependent protease
MESNPISRLIAMLPAFLLAITLHEFAHGYVAYRFGDDTAKRAGRLTLSPLAHLDPLGTIMFLVSAFGSGIGFGWAKPVPVNPAYLRNPRRDDIFVSLAGVTANLLQAVAWALLLRLAVWAAPGSLRDTLAIFCWYGVELNMAFLVFNLLPIPPLDGSRVFARLLGIRDPYAVDRMAPLGFVLLVVFVRTPAFGWVIGHVLEPLLGVFLRIAGG